MKTRRILNQTKAIRKQKPAANIRPTLPPAPSDFGSTLDHVQYLLGKWRPAFKQDRTFQRVVSVVVGLLTCQGRSTLTNSILYRGGEQQDWSADYRVFNRSEWSIHDVFRPALLESVKEVDEDEFVVLALDDTSLPKAGSKIPQARWCHDPLAPKFMDMAIRWGIRMLHAAIIVPNWTKRYARRASRPTRSV